MDWMGLLFTPIKPFVAHPERIVAVATALFVMFGLLGFSRGRWPWPLLWATGLWAAFDLVDRDNLGPMGRRLAWQKGMNV